MKQALKQLNRWVDIVLIVVIAAIAYLPLVNQLGFYRDDWHVIWGGTLIGAGKIFDLHLVDRPFMGLIYSLTYRVLGNSPLAWQLYVVALRIAGGLLLLWLLRLIWPGKRLPTTLMALLFTIYPGFLQMPTATAYSNHLVGLGMGILSLALTVKALQVSRRVQRIFLILAAVLSGLFCFLIMEYMISLEGVRIILLAYLYARYQPGKLLAKGWRLFKVWLPYFAGMLLFLVWRVLIFKSARATTDLGSLVSSYLSNPLYMLGQIILETIKGALNALVLAWFIPFYNLVMSASAVHLLIAFLLAIAAIAVFIVCLRNLQAPDDSSTGTSDDHRWAKEAVWLGLIITIINILPIVLANREVRLTDTLDRYTLPASIGVVMVLVGSLNWLMRRSFQAPLVASLIAISIFTHFNNAVFFKNFWSYEKQLWWQLSWRAPDIKDDTVLIPALPGAYSLAESYEIWGPANLMYGTAEDPLQVVGEALNLESMHSVIIQTSFTRNIRRVEFTLDFKNSLVLSIPTSTSCLRALDGDWLEYSENDSLLTRQVAPYSDTSLIDASGTHNQLPAEIFGEEPEHTWCYYYEKADLARQEADWAEVARLGDEVRAAGYQPQDVMEWMPFYQGYAYSGRIEDANELAGLIRGEREALQEFCTQFTPETFSQLKEIGGAEQYIVINLCPQEN